MLKGVINWQKKLSATCDIIFIYYKKIELNKNYQIMLII